MKPILMVAALAGGLVLTGCDDPAVVSLEAFAAPGDAITDPALAGAWQEKDDSDLIVIKRNGAVGYTVIYYDDSSSRKFDALLFKVGDAEFLDVVPKDDDDFRVKAHTLFRVWPEAGRLGWAFVDTEWFRGQAVAVASRPLAEGKSVLTGPTAALRGLVERAAGDERAHGQVFAWERLQ